MSPDHRLTCLRVLEKKTPDLSLVSRLSLLIPFPFCITIFHEASMRRYLCGTRDRWVCCRHSSMIQGLYAAGGTIDNKNQVSVGLSNRLQDIMGKTKRPLVYIISRSKIQRMRAT